MNFHPQAHPRHLVLVLGDQLNQDSAAFDGFDPARDAVWMAEVAEESTRVWSHKARIAMFLSAMRHFRDALRRQGLTVHYRQLDDAANSGNFGGELTTTTSRLSPQRLIWVEPGEWRVQTSLESTARALGVDFEVRPDRHFFCSREEFARHAAGRKQLRMEFFYREMRRKHRVLMDGDEPAGGAWNFDTENREAFGKDGPDTLRPQPRRFEPDAVTREVLALVEDRFAKHPGSLDAVRLAGHPGGCGIGPGRFYYAPAVRVRPLAGRDVDQRAVALSFAAQRGHESEASRPASRHRCR